MNIEYVINDIAQLEGSLNYNLLSAPFTPNTFSLWRDIKYKQIDSSLTQEFVEQVDNVLFYKFLEKVRHHYTQKLQFDDLKLDLQFDVDPKKIKEIMENDLKQQQETLTRVMAQWQAEVEYAYDLLRRIHTYQLVEYQDGGQQALDKLPFQEEEQSKFYSKYLDKMMNGLLGNIQELTTEKLKQICATGIIKNNSVWESGKQLLKNFIISKNSTMAVVSNFNLGLFVGGLIAEAVVKQVGVKIITQNLKRKLEHLEMELLEMTNTLVKVNYGLDRLIYKCVCDPNGLDQYKKDISAYIQKFYKVNSGPETIYCPETNEVITVTDEGGVLIVRQQEYNVQIEEVDDVSIIHCSLEQPQVINNYLSQ